MARKPTEAGEHTARQVFVSSGQQVEVREAVLRILTASKVAPRLEAIVKNAEALRIGLGGLGSELPTSEVTEETILASLVDLIDAGTGTEIDETLARLGVGIDRETEKLDEILSRLRRTRIAA